MARALTFTPPPRSVSSASQCLSKSKSEEAQRSSPTMSEDSSEILRRALSMRSVVSTSSNFAERVNKAGAPIIEEIVGYNIIGVGSCGTVFEIPGRELAYKKGPNVEAIWKDFLNTCRVYNAILDTREVLQITYPDISIPQTPYCSKFILPSNKEYWDTHLQRYPVSHRNPGAAIELSRILPLPRPVREALIDTFFEDNDQSKEEAKNNEDNKHCLMRVYLGESESPKQQTAAYDSLQNFPMRLNMMEELGLDVTMLAKEMAIALAIIHWQAEIDGMDTESVLGSVATKPRAYSKDYDSVVLPPPTDVT